MRKIAQAKFRDLERRALARLPATTDDIVYSELGREALERLQDIPRNSDLFQARKLYVKGLTPAEISHETGIPLEDLMKLINNPNSGWKLQRERIFEDVARSLQAETMPVMRDIRGVGLALIKASFEARERELPDKPVTLSEANQIAMILRFITNEIRLDEDSAEQKKQKSLSTQEIFEAFVDDPYLGPAIRKMSKKVVPVEVGPDGNKN